MKQTKAIILAGGLGTRLWPITAGISKQLLPVYDKPMIYYSLTTAMLTGCKDIILISTPRDIDDYQHLLGDGSQWGINIEYLVQTSPDGLPQAFILSEHLISNFSVCLILGDNFVYGPGLGRNLSTFFQDQGACITAYEVADPSELGVVVFTPQNTVSKLIEKPKNLESRWAVPGIYFYDHQVVERSKELKKSSRGELEIMDLNNSYLADGLLTVNKLPRGTAWLDLGTPDGILEAAQFVKLIEDRQGLLVGSPDEVALRTGWISRDLFLKNIEGKNSLYAQSLRRVQSEF
jgi:glucose-1-phosphate thymidylyltransferase